MKPMNIVDYNYDCANIDKDRKEYGENQGMRKVWLSSWSCAYEMVVGIFSLLKTANFLRK